MTEAQDQGQATPESSEQAQPANQDSKQNLTWEDHTRELQRVGKKEKSEGKKAGRSSVLEELGFDDFGELKSTVEAYRLVESENETATDKLQKQLDKLSPKAEKADKYEEALNAILESEREGLPEYILDALEGKDAPDQLTYIAKHREAIAEASGAAARPQTIGRGSAPGNGSTAPPDPAVEHANWLLDAFTR